MSDVIVDNNSPEEIAMRQALVDIEDVLKERLKCYKKTNKKSKKGWILQKDKLMKAAEKFMKMMGKYCNG